MSRNTIVGSVILLAIVSIALLLHTLPCTERSEPRVLGLESRVFTFPEQKFLINGPLDINTATVDELEAIPRIGPALALRIIEFRKVKGKINSINELLEVSGIGPRILERIKPYFVYGTGNTAGHL